MSPSYGYILFYEFFCWLTLKLASALFPSFINPFTLCRAWVTFRLVDFLIIRPFETEAHCCLYVTHIHGDNLGYLIQLFYNVSAVSLCHRLSHCHIIFIVHTWKEFRIIRCCFHWYYIWNTFLLESKSN